MITTPYVVQLEVESTGVADGLALVVPPPEGRLSGLAVGTGGALASRGALEEIMDLNKCLGTPILAWKIETREPNPAGTQLEDKGPIGFYQIFVGNKWSEKMLLGMCSMNGKKQSTLRCICHCGMPLSNDVDPQTTNLRVSSSA